MELQAFITATNKAASARELVALWQETMVAAGWDRLLFSLLTDHPSIDHKAGHIVAVNFPKDWLARYFSKGFELMRQHMFLSKGAFTWNELVSTKRLSAAQISVFAQGPGTAMYSGVAIPLRGPFGVYGGVTAAASVGSVALTKDILACVQLFSHQFYIRFLDLEQRSGGNEGIQLTEQERQVLTWYALGKSQPEIAIILGVSLPAIKFHLNRIFKKLDVHNDRVAVLKATAMGLIVPKHSF